MIRSAPIAIAAMLALGPTPGFAQTAQPDAAPPTSGPILQLPVDPAPQQRPTIVLPSDTTPAPASSAQPVAPVVQPTIAPLEVDPPAAVTEKPAPRPAAKAAKRTAAPARKAASTTSAPAPAVASAPAEAAAPSAPLVVDSAPLAEQAAPMPAAAMPEPAKTADASPEGESDTLALAVLALAGLIPIGFAVFALMWFRRRSRRASAEELAYAEAATIEPAPAPEPIAPAVATVPVLDREPAPAPYRAQPATAAPARHPLDGYKGLPNRGAAVALPKAIPETIEERDALLQRMIEAEPDKANPFTSRKARARRARLILQSLGRTFENVKPRFDLSQYTANWPALANRRPGYA